MKALSGLWFIASGGLLGRTSNQLFVSGIKRAIVPIILSLLASLLFFSPHACASCPAPDSAIEVENCLAGTPQNIWDNLNLMKKNRLSARKLSDIRLNLK